MRKPTYFSVSQLIEIIEPTKGLEPLTCALRVLNSPFVLIRATK